MTDVAQPPRPPEPAAVGLDLSGNPLPLYAAAPSDPLGHSPLRRPGSIRRTMTVEVDWPGEDAVHGRFQGRARDIYTPVDGDDPVLIAQDAITGHFADRRTIADVAAIPPRADVASLAGERAGSNLRTAIDRVLHREKQEGAPLYLLLDDLAGASLVCMWGWARWHPGYLQEQAAVLEQAAGAGFTVASMEGVCIGFRPGSSALLHKPGQGTPNSTQVVPLPNPADPAGWHAFALDGDFGNFRRARLIDIWREDGLIHVDALFQDTSSLPGTAMREAIHEYRLRATADGATGRLLTLDATPGTLPHAECPAAMVNMAVVLGTPMEDLRATVLDRLKRTAGCTHLNDMIRSLAEAPVLAAKLPA
ncbi:DUF2889 domain-containing protein [Sphingobium sufflavum]|uniref:DUF2889 domain-containing protein n=1 Tax=Sphingobium sufflavum TaxID=1129547 RepID=UPI001F17C316|nr:DUF2889 domain-containing protein [Sphingobium sufflavum]MCE7798371.1 DUF2889 domain-containing protein [Sphingobium sufflavum]